MSALHFDIENQHKNYLDEKELFVLYHLLRHKRISTQWSNVFVPNPKEIPVKPDTTDQELFDRLTYRGQSVLVLNYLAHLGKTLDKDGYSIYCNADYSLVEGGLLSQYMTKNIKSIRIKFRRWKLKCQNTARQTTITKQPLLQSYL